MTALVERLLASPRYGERWGRYWLDVARYADTKGYVLFQDANFHWAYTYRDYVIGAFNQDLPYDRFLIEQIAADRLPAEDGQKAPDGARVSHPGRPVHGQCPRRDRRSDRRRLSWAHELDGHLRPLSRPQVRSDSRAGLLLALRRAGQCSRAGDPAGSRLSPSTRRPTRQFVKELESRQRKLSEFVAAKHREMVESSKHRAAEYLLAAQKALDQPTTEDFMLLADGNDLNPTMLVRWQVYLARTRKTHDPVFAPWHALASLPEKRFCAGCRPGDREVRAGERRSADARFTRGWSTPSFFERLPRGLLARWPRSLSVYGQLLNGVEQLWQERVCRAALDGRTPEPLPDAGT